MRLKAMTRPSGANDSSPAWSSGSGCGSPPCTGTEKARLSLLADDSPAERNTILCESGVQATT